MEPAVVLDIINDCLNNENIPVNIRPITIPLEFSEYMYFKENLSSYLNGDTLKKGGRTFILKSIGKKV